MSEHCANQLLIDKYFEKFLCLLDKRTAELEMLIKAMQGKPGRNGRDGINGRDGLNGNNGTTPAASAPIIFFGATAIAPIAVVGVEVASYLSPYNKFGAAIPSVALTGINVIPVGAQLVSFGLPAATARLFRNPYVLIESPIAIVGDLVFTFGTLTYGLLGQATFNPSPLVVTIPAGTIAALTVLRIEGAATSTIFPAGSIVTVRVTTTGLVGVGVGVAASIFAEYTNPAI